MNKNTALLIIDVQVVLFAREKSDGKKIFMGDQLLSNVNILREKARLSRSPVLYIQHTGTDDSIIAKGKPLWEIHPRIKPEVDDIIIAKCHADAFNDTSLHEKLQTLKINRLIITGLQTEFCIDTTCRRGFSKGYTIVLASDCHSTFDSAQFTAPEIIQHHNWILGGGDPYAEKFAELKKTEEITFDSE